MALARCAAVSPPATAPATLGSSTCSSSLGAASPPSRPQHNSDAPRTSPSSSRACAATAESMRGSRADRRSSWGARPSSACRPCRYLLLESVVQPSTPLCRMSNTLPRFSATKSARVCADAALSTISSDPAAAPVSPVSACPRWSLSFCAACMSATSPSSISMAEEAFMGTSSTPSPAPPSIPRSSTGSQRRTAHSSCCAAAAATSSTASPRSSSSAATSSKSSLARARPRCRQKLMRWCSTAARTAASRTLTEAVRSDTARSSMPSTGSRISAW
mmetsp:Transcript_28510/g.63201  ORF Transcript_28510/g.63201 Transcript_28510/m.63201 type:complete len:275 (-) Transcript_28510:756-1580(-)